MSNSTALEKAAAKLPSLYEIHFGYIKLKDEVESLIAQGLEVDPERLELLHAHEFALKEKCDIRSKLIGYLEKEIELCQEEAKRANARRKQLSSALDRLKSRILLS